MNDKESHGDRAMVACTLCAVAGAISLAALQWFLELARALTSGQ
jgi:hypothetical protein